jgi:Uma2 family endonuclease
MALDRTRKLAVYVREQVPLAWLVDPTAHTIEVLQLDAGRWVIVTTCAGSGAVSLPPFDALPLDLTLLWEAPDS